MKPTADKPQEASWYAGTAGTMTTGRSLVPVGEIDPSVVVAREPGGDAAEGIRALATRLMVGGHAEAARTLAVVSPNAGDGRSFVAANLAVLFATAGRRTLLIDADFRSPCQHALFNVEHAAGFAQLLQRRADWSVVRSVRGVPGLHLIAAGEKPTAGVGYLGDNYLAELLGELRGVCDQIVIDTPPTEAYSDAQAVAAHAGAAILVVRRGHTRLERARAAVGDMRAAGTSLLGAVVNDH